MEIGMLREFITLSECLNFTKAAERLHVTQPTLSKHIVAMEHELGCSLLLRDRRHVSLSEEGQMFAAAALQIVDTYDDCQRRISDRAKQEPLHVGGIIFDPAISSLVSIASTLLDDSGAQTVIYSHLAEETDFITKLLNDDIDIAITYVQSERIDELQLERIPLTRTRFVALVAKTCALAQRRETSIDDLRNYRFIKFADNYSISGWYEIERACRAHGFAPRTRAVLGRNNSNYASTPLGPEDVMILPNNLPQLRYLSDFSQVAVLPVVDDDAFFRLFAIYKIANKDKVKQVLEAYAQARRIIINHGKGGALVEKD